MPQQKAYHITHIKNVRIGARIRKSARFHGSAGLTVKSETDGARRKSSGSLAGMQERISLQQALLAYSLSNFPNVLCSHGPAYGIALPMKAGIFAVFFLKDTHRQCD